MASVHHDDSIEILSPQGAAHLSHYFPVDDGFFGPLMAEIASPAGPRALGPQVLAPVETRTTSRKQHLRHGDVIVNRPSQSKSAKEKRLRKCVVVVAAFMVVSCLVLVGASLSMSNHIDEMGERRIEMSKTSAAWFYFDVSVLASMMVTLTLDTPSRVRFHFESISSYEILHSKIAIVCRSI